VIIIITLASVLLQVVIAFHGNETISGSAMDFKFLPARAASGSCPKNDRIFDNASQTRTGKVHAGWHHAWACMEDAVFLLVDRITSRSCSWTVILTGYSFGGALATLAASAFSSRPCATTQLSNTILKQGMYTKKGSIEIIRTESMSLNLDRFFEEKHEKLVLLHG
jgi:hypothetical protein